MDLPGLQAEVERGLGLADDELRSFFRSVRCVPRKWQLHPWGDEGGGFWVVATHRERALWFNDIEDGFNVSSFDRAGRIPSDQYRCNQDEMHLALRLLRDGQGIRLGPPRPVDA
ncbi:MAG: hypothetical protein KDE27_32895 [Planctomycetes bacterium]|nr:hypothetical protein [Planctomycetota bacterium]